MARVKEEVEVLDTLHQVDQVMETVEEGKMDIDTKARKTTLQFTNISLNISVCPFFILIAVQKVEFNINQDVILLMLFL